MGNADYTAATYTVLFSIYDMFARNNVPENVATILTKSLKKSSQKPWKEAAEILYKGINDVMNLKRNNE